MSVPKGKRGVSKREFFYKVTTLTDKITQLLLRDFGVKNLNRDLVNFAYKARMSEEDRIAYVELCTRYNINVEANFPAWLIEKYRDKIMDECFESIKNVTTADSIYPADPNFDILYSLRLQYQNKAIANCNTLLQELQAAGRVLPVDYNKFMPYVDLITEEINALKNWRKAMNKIKNEHDLKNHN